MLPSFVDLTEPETIDLTAPDTIEILSSDSEEELEALFNPLAPLPQQNATESLVCASDNSDTSDDSSLGMGNAYGDFSPLFDMKKSIAPLGYIDYMSTVTDVDSLSCDSWFVDHCWWLETPQTSVAPLSWLPPAFRESNFGAHASLETSKYPEFGVSRSFPVQNYA